MTDPESASGKPCAATSAVFRKTLSETDLILFAGLSGDQHPVHIDERSEAAQDAGGRTIHAVFLIGLMSTAVSRLMQRRGLRTRVTAFRAVRFHAAAHPGDTVQAAARIASPSRAGVLEVEISATTDKGTLLAAGIAEVQVL
jgi:3-hydroxybutyryl-CoA dehydratase